MINNENISDEEKDFGIWLANGIDRGWVSDPYCHTHDGGYEFMSEEEIEEWEAGEILANMFLEFLFHNNCLFSIVVVPPPCKRIA